MSDDKATQGKADRQQIDVDDPDELVFWAKSIGVTPEALKSAVQQVGPGPDKVRIYFNRKLDPS